VYFQISRQASVVLQNISLLNETRRRLQEVNLLLEFSRRLGGLEPAQIVRALLESGRRVLQGAHAGVVLLWNEQSQLLEPQAASGYADNEGLMHIAYHRGEALPGGVFAAGKPRRVDEVNFPRDYVLTKENLGIYREATGGRLPVSSLLLPITTGEKGIGLIVLDNFNTPGAFRPEDEALMLSLTQQVALSLENVRLVHAMTERAGQLQALNDVATAMTSSLRSEDLVAALLDQLGPILPFDTATLWLRENEKLTVAAARGFPDTEKRLGLTLAVTDSALFKEMVKNGLPISVGDVRDDARFPAVEAPRLSWLGIPLISKGELTGLIALEKWQAYFYSREQIQLATTFAGQAAIALDNANLYEESLGRAADLDERSQRLALLNRFSSTLSGLLEAGQILELTAEELRNALNVSRVSAITMEHGQALWQLDSPPSMQRLPQALPDAPLFTRLQESLGIFNTEAVSAEPDLRPLRDFLHDNLNSLLVVPLAGAQELRALMFAQAPSDRHFSPTEIELARTVANQASIALENARLYESTVRTAERLAILNQVSAEIGGSLEAEEIYASIHRAVERLMPLEAFVISLLDQEANEVEGVYLVDMNHRAPNMRVPLGQGLSSHVIRTGEPLLINGAENAEEMGAIAVGEHGAAISTLAVPLVLGGKTMGMLSAQSYKENAYSLEDLQILSTLANQASVSIQNGRLFGETQRLARELEQRVIERTAQLRREQQNTETLLRILTEVSSSLDLDRALNRTLSLLNDAVGADQGTIMLLNAEDNLLHYRAGYGYLSEKAGSDERGLTLKIGQGLAGWVVENREAALVDDLLQDRRWVRSASASREHRSAVVAPLLVAEDVIGVLMVFSRTENYFSGESLNLVKAIASQVAVAINNAHLYELIRDQAERLGLMLRKEQEEASRSQAILEAVADGVLVTGPDNRISFLNSSVENILGIDAGKVLGRSLEESRSLFGKAGTAWMETIRRWSSVPGAYESGDSYAEQLELGDNRVALVHLAPVVLQDDFLGTVSIFRDITHEVEVDRLKSEFVATVSHELRTPMTAIKGYVEILLMGAAGAINENQSHFLDIVKNNIDRLNVLVGDLLDVSRIEAGRVTLATQALDMREVIKDVVGEIENRSSEDKKPMTVALEAPRSLPRALGDPERVHQVLLNLLDNAYHYTPENGAIKVRVHALTSRGEIEVDVIDNGVGIPKAEQDRVFERFYRGEHPFVLATPGTGLGLAIVKQLVEMHKGRIWMKSTGVAGEGSAFSFTLPIYKEG
jgi:PAS domain S-box-containing protein